MNSQEEAKVGSSTCNNRRLQIGFGHCIRLGTSRNQETHIWMGRCCRNRNIHYPLSLARLVPAGGGDGMRSLSLPLEEHPTFPLHHYSKGMPQLPPHVNKMTPPSLDQQGRSNPNPFWGRRGGSKRSLWDYTPQPLGLYSSRQCSRHTFHIRNAPPRRPRRAIWPRPSPSKKKWTQGIVHRPMRDLMPFCLGGICCRTKLKQRLKVSILSIWSLPMLEKSMFSSTMNVTYFSY